MAKTLVYENVNEYTLTLQVRNSPDLVAEAQLIIKVKDVNNLVSVKIFYWLIGSVKEIDSGFRPY